MRQRTQLGNQVETGSRWPDTLKVCAEILMYPPSPSLSPPFLSRIREAHVHAPAETREPFELKLVALASCLRSARAFSPQRTKRVSIKYIRLLWRQNAHKTEWPNAKGNAKDIDFCHALYFISSASSRRRGIYPKMSRCFPVHAYTSAGNSKHRV